MTNLPHPSVGKAHCDALLVSMEFNALHLVEWNAWAPAVPNCNLHLNTVFTKPTTEIGVLFKVMVLT